MPDSIGTWIMLSAMSGWIAWALVTGWPWRRVRRFNLRRRIAAAPERIWTAYWIDPDRFRSSPFHANIVSARRVENDPETIEYVVDTSGGHGTHQTEVRIRTLQVRPNEFTAWQTRDLDGRSLPFGPEHAETLELRPGPEGTAVALSWRGQTATLGQHIRRWRSHGRYLKRLQQYCESGTVAPVVPRQSAATGIALSLLALVGLALWLGWMAAFLLAAVLLVHEFGHWLAMRLTGQPSPRMMLVPFFGGVTLANHPHRTLFDDAFCALMGAGISALPCLALLIATWHMGSLDEGATDPLWRWTMMIAFAFGVLNLLQLLPFLPLDGGQVLRALMQSLHAAWARRILIGIGALGVLGFGSFGEFILAGLFAVGALQAWHLPEHPPKAHPMRSGGMAVIGCGLVLTVAVHATAVVYWGSVFGLGPLP